MSRIQYYESLKKLARDVRDEYSLTSARVMPSEIKMILKSKGVKEIVLFHDFKNLRGAYMIEDGLPIVVVKKWLPPDPYAFTLGHELKHHLVDQKFGSLVCTNKNISEEIEIGAEIFSAELLYPEQLFLYDIQKRIGSRECTPEDIVHLKRETGTTLSYAGLTKRVLFLKLGKEKNFEKIPWKALEERIFGIPFYKRRNSQMKPN